MKKLKIIAEIGINHNGDFRKIEELVRQVSVGRTDYAKFQLYDSVRVFGDDSRKQNEFTFKQVEDIKSICDFYGIEFFASVFDEEKLGWCEQLDVNIYKIASRTVVKEPKLCEEIIAIGKPTYISLGFWDQEGLPFTDKNIEYLHCISKYPTTHKDLVTDFEYNNEIIGLSDHSYGIAFCLYNIARGARVIEKHFTLDKSMDGNDHIGSMTLDELKTLREYGNQIYNIAESK